MQIRVNNRLRGARPVATGVAVRIARYAGTHLSLSPVRGKDAPRGFSAYHWVQGSALPRKRETCARFRIQAAAAIISACILAACAPTIRMDAPGLPAISSRQSASDCSNALNTEKEKIAPLDPPPQLPDALQAPCPLGSGLAACFTLDQDLVRQKRFKILHDDRDYCRDAYERARERANEQRLAQ